MDVITILDIIASHIEDNDIDLFKLGEKIGRHIAAVFPEKNTSILVLERGGRFFGDGVYMGAGGIFYSMNPKQDDAPVINTERVVIVDSVINTGKSIMRIIDELKNHNPGIDVIIAANVIQNEAVELFKDYLVFATRLSKNSFVGVNQSKQTGKTGPDTADRLFNLIKKRYWNDFKWRFSIKLQVFVVVYNLRKIAQYGF